MAAKRRRSFKAQTIKVCRAKKTGRFGTCRGGRKTTIKVCRFKNGKFAPKAYCK